MLLVALLRVAEAIPQFKPYPLFAASTPVSPTVGISGLNAHCQADATANSLPGTWVAVASTSTRTIASLIQTLPPNSGIYRPDTTTQLATLSDFVSSSSLLQPVTFANGTEVPLSYAVWTGSDANGAFSSSCNDWTSNSASVTAQVGLPSTKYPVLGSPTNYEHHLYRQQGNGGAWPCDLPGPSVMCIRTWQPVTIFATANAYAANAGVAAFDAACATEAGTNSITGTFRALVSTSVTPLSSLIPANAELRRLDRTAIAFTTTAFLSSTPLIDVIQMSNSTLAPTSYAVWTGSDVNGGVSTTCSDWTSSSNSDSGQVGFPAPTYPLPGGAPGYEHHLFRTVGNGAGWPCGTPGPSLYCIERFTPPTSAPSAPTTAPTYAPTMSTEAATTEAATTEAATTEAATTEAATTEAATTEAATTEAATTEAATTEAATTEAATTEAATTEAATTEAATTEAATTTATTTNAATTVVTTTAVPTTVATTVSSTTAKTGTSTPATTAKGTTKSTATIKPTTKTSSAYIVAPTIVFGLVLLI